MRALLVRPARAAPSSTSTLQRVGCRGLEPLNQARTRAGRSRRRQQRQRRGGRAHDSLRDGVFSGRCSSDFFFRIAPSTARGKLQRLDATLVFAPPHGREHLLRRRPGRPVDRAVLPPRPDFLGHERQKRRKQPQHRRERRQQRAVRGRGELGP